MAWLHIGTFSRSGLSMENPRRRSLFRSIYQGPRDFRNLSRLPTSAGSGSALPHSLACLAHESIGLSMKRLHAAFYGGKRLFAHHSIVLSDTPPYRRFLRHGICPKLIAIICHPLRSHFNRKTQLVQRQQSLNDANDDWGRTDSRQKPRAP